MGLLSNVFGGRAPLPDDERARQERSWAELKAGRLPLSAQERLGEHDEDPIFAAAMSPAELVAVRAAGYEPVGQAFGTSTVAVSRTQALLQSQPPFGYSPAGFQNFQMRDGTTSPRWSSAGGRPWPIRGYFEPELRSRERALRRMQTECQALGGEGVIGIRTVRSSHGEGIYEYTVIGTAVRARGVKVTGTPFLAALSGADFGALARAGWLPVTMVVSMVRWASFGMQVMGLAGPTTSIGSRWAPTQELTALSQLQIQARSQAREQLESQVRKAQADGMLLHEFAVRVEGGEQFGIEVEAVGTAIRRAGPTSSLPKNRPPLNIRPVVRLDGSPSIDL